jgi:hypothetical protein
LVQISKILAWDLFLLIFCEISLCLFCFSYGLSHKCFMLCFSLLSPCYFILVFLCLVFFSVLGGGLIFLHCMCFLFWFIVLSYKRVVYDRENFPYLFKIYVNFLQVWLIQSWPKFFPPLTLFFLFDLKLLGLQIKIALYALV